MIRAEDLKVETWPPRERGGQHVTRTVSGVRVTHLPSGVQAAVCCLGQSQHVNRQIAVDMILAAITHPKFR